MASQPHLNLLQIGPSLFVNIGFDPTYKPGKTPIAGVSNVEALIDAGAKISCIDEPLAIQLGLPAVNKRRLGGIGGIHIATMYMAQVQLSGLPFTIWGNFAGVQLAATGSNYKALIGRAFLQYFTMLYEGQTGTVILSR